MFKKLFLVSCAVLGIAALPQYALEFSKLVPVNAGSGTGPRVSAAVASPEAKTQPVAHYAAGFRAASIPMDKAGHFSADFRVNGRYVRGLIDTGATYVALNTSTARSLGVKLSESDFIHEVSTANGRIKAALIMLDKIEVGSISVKNVEAFVLDNQALSALLIGMSFMSKIDSYRVANNRLELVN